MPYRRLPNTDQARIRAMKVAILQFDGQHFGKPVFSYKTKHEVDVFLQTFERQNILYKQALNNQIKANKQYQQILNNARMYISHFIQVLNMCVMRDEIKKEHKEYYHLNPEDNNVPSLTTESNIVMWGKNIIMGETNRLRIESGKPIYNPTIAKVKVHYEIFKEYKSNQKMYQTTTQRNHEELVKLREKIDGTILDIWNQVEAHFADIEDQEERLDKCKTYGVVYYYRKNEK